MHSDIANPNETAMCTAEQSNGQNSILVTLSITQQQMELTFMADQKSQSVDVVKSGLPEDNFIATAHVNETRPVIIDDNNSELHVELNKAPTENDDHEGMVMDGRTLANDQLETVEQNSSESMVYENNATDMLEQEITQMENDEIETTTSDNASETPWEGWPNVDVDDDAISDHADEPNDSNMKRCKHVDFNAISLEVTDSNLNNTTTIEIRSDTLSIKASAKNSLKRKVRNENGGKNHRMNVKKTMRKFDVKKYTYDFRQLFLKKEPPLKRYLSQLKKPLNEPEL